MNNKKYDDILDQAHKYLKEISNVITFIDDDNNDIQEQLTEIKKNQSNMINNSINKEIITRVNISIDLKIIYTKLNDSIEGYKNNIKEREQQFNKIQTFTDQLDKELDKLNKDSLQYIELNNINLSLKIQNNYLAKVILLEKETVNKISMTRDKVDINLRLLDSLKKLQQMSYKNK